MAVNIKGAKANLLRKAEALRKQREEAESATPTTTPAEDEDSAPTPESKPKSKTKKVKVSTEIEIELDRPPIKRGKAKSSEPASEDDDGIELPEEPVHDPATEDDAGDDEVISKLRNKSPLVRVSGCSGVDVITPRIAQVAFDEVTDPMVWIALLKADNAEDYADKFLEKLRTRKHLPTELVTKPWYDDRFLYEDFEAGRLANPHEGIKHTTSSAVLRQIIDLVISRDSPDDLADLVYVFDEDNKFKLKVEDMNYLFRKLSESANKSLVHGTTLAGLLPKATAGNWPLTILMWAYIGAHYADKGNMVPQLLENYRVELIAALSGK